jgi:hypothetical protein
VALPGVPPVSGKVHVGDGLGFGDVFGDGDGDGVGDGEADGAGLAEALGVGVAGGLPPVGPDGPQAASRIESPIQAMTRMPEGSHRDSPSHRAGSHAVYVTLDLGQTPAAACCISSRSWC